MDFDYYSGRDLTYPVQPKRPTLAVNHTSEAALAYAAALVDYESALVDYRAEADDYNAKIKARMAEFKETLHSLYNLNHKQFSLLWDRAWEDVHSSGLREVATHFKELVELVDRFNLLAD